MAGTVSASRGKTPGTGAQVQIEDVNGSSFTAHDERGRQLLHPGRLSGRRPAGEGAGLARAATSRCPRTSGARVVRRAATRSTPGPTSPGPVYLARGALRSGVPMSGAGGSCRRRSLLVASLVGAGRRLRARRCRPTPASESTRRTDRRVSSGPSSDFLDHPLRLARLPRSDRGETCASGAARACASIPRPARSAAAPGGTKRRPPSIRPPTDRSSASSPP